MPVVYCDQKEKGNLNIAAQAQLHDNNQQADAIDGYLQLSFTGM